MLAQCSIDDGQVNAETVLELTGLIYDAVADSARWQTFVDAFGRAVSATICGVSVLPAGDPTAAIACMYGLSETAVREYNVRYCHSDPWQPGTARWPEGVVGTDTDLCPREEMEASAAYREFYAPNNAVYGMGATILATGIGRSVITATRGFNQALFGEKEKALLRVLLPHLRRAAVLHCEFGSLRRQVAAFTDHLSRYPHALFLVDASCRLIYGNRAAHSLLQSGNDVNVREGRLSIAPARQDTALRRVVAEVSAGLGEPVRRVLAPRASGGAPYLLLAMPLQDPATTLMGGSIPAVSILLMDPALRPEFDTSILRDLFSLTPAESRVAGKLAGGLGVDEIAAEMGITVETVRTHLKRALSKTATKRQGELIALVLRSVPLQPGSAASGG